MIAQTAVFVGLTPHELFESFLSASAHAAMTADGIRPAAFLRGPEGAMVPRGEEGDELRAVGVHCADGKTLFAVEAKLLKVVPDRTIVLAWKSIAWRLAVDRGEVTDSPSIAILTFKKNIAGAEIGLVQTEVPEYRVRIPLMLDELGDMDCATRAAAQLAPGGEVGPLQTLVNTHWSLIYWEPMKHYFAAQKS